MQPVAAEPPPQRFRLIHAALLYLLATLIVFGDLLYSSGQVVSRWGTDLSVLFLGLRDFGFRELAHGHLALWNPHLFCGSPFLAGFQSALLYPPNWLYLILPTTRAVNLDVALHVWLSGLFACAWARHRRLHPAACLMAGLVFMFGGPHVLHVYAGHLSQLCTIAWAPLVLLGIDGAIDAHAADRPKWVVVGSFALAMQILAGFPQYVLYLGIVTVPYVLFRVFASRPPAAKPIRLIGARSVALLLLVVGALGLAAAQWVAGAGVVGESARRHLPWLNAGSFFLPPENLLTLLAPGFFGNMGDAAYWGRWYLWEGMLFVGLTPLVLAIYGAVRGPATQRPLAVTLLILSLLLAFGPLTPLFRLVYDFIPAGDSFRGPAKFTLPALCWIAMLAAVGLHRVLTLGRVPRAIPWAAAITGAIVFAMAAVIHQSAPAGAAGLWGRSLLGLPWGGYGRYTAMPDARTLSGYGSQAAGSLAWAAATLLVLAALLFVSRRAGVLSRRMLAVGLLGLTAVELLVFARQYRPTFRLDLLEHEETNLAAIVSSLPPDARVLYANQTEAMRTGAQTVWGNDAMVLQRYLDMAHALEGDAKPAAETDPTAAPFTRVTPKLSLVRLGAVLQAVGNGQLSGYPLAARPLPRALLVPTWRVVPDRQAACRALAEGSVPFTQQVILEQDPGLPAPAVSPAASQPSAAVTVTDTSTDSFEIQTTTSHPGVLLITDNYAQGWHAEPIDPGPQPRYVILPADVGMRGIPLLAGSHHIRLRYAPASVTVGKWISLISLIAWAAALVFLRRGLTRRTIPTAAASTPQSKPAARVDPPRRRKNNRGR